MATQIVRNTIFGVFVSLLTFSSSFAENSYEVVLTQSLMVPQRDTVAFSVVLTFSPGDLGKLPHYHSGPAVFYVLEGSYLFQVENSTARIVSKGESCYVKDRTVHIWGANALDHSTCRVLVTVFGRPNEAKVTYVRNYQRKLNRKETLKIANRNSNA